MNSLEVMHLDQPVLHGGRRATFLHMNRGAAIIRYWGDSHAVAVPLEALSTDAEELAHVTGKDLARAFAPCVSSRVLSLIGDEKTIRATMWPPGGPSP